MKISKEMKKKGKVSFDAPNKKERKNMPPPTQKHKKKKGKGSYDRKKEDVEEDEENPCWKGYKQYGTKKKNGKEVPNCVKEQQIISRMVDCILEKNYSDAHKYLKEVLDSKTKNRIKEELTKPLF